MFQNGRQQDIKIIKLQLELLEFQQFSHGGQKNSVQNHYNPCNPSSTTNNRAQSLGVLSCHIVRARSGNLVLTSRIVRVQD